MTDKYRCRCSKSKTVIPGSPWADKVDNPICPHCNNDNINVTRLTTLPKKLVVYKLTTMIIIKEITLPRLQTLMVKNGL